MGVTCLLLNILSLQGFFLLGLPAFLPTFFLFFHTHILENCLIICFGLGRASHHLLTLWLKAVNKYIIFSKCIFTLQNGRKVFLWLEFEAFTWWWIWFRAQTVEEFTIVSLNLHGWGLCLYSARVRWALIRTLPVWAWAQVNGDSWRQLTDKRVWSWLHGFRKFYRLLLYLHRKTGTMFPSFHMLCNSSLCTLFLQVYLIRCHLCKIFIVGGVVCGDFLWII